MKQTDNGQKGRKRKNWTSENFIEALRRINQRPVGEKKEENILFQEQEREIKRRSFFREKKGWQEAKKIYDARERELKEQILALRAELAAIIKNEQQVEKEVAVAVEQTSGEASVYHFHFLLFLKKLILKLQKSRRAIEESSQWLIAWNKRAKKKGAFWRTFTGKRGGSKFLLSSEHYLTRSAG